MFRIRRIFDEILPVNKETIRQVKEIFYNRFQSARTEEIDIIGEKLTNPFKHRFRTILFVAENMRGKVIGFAMLLHEPEINFCFLDWIATSNEKNSSGIGSALYQRVRSEAEDLKVNGIFFECLPDDMNTCPDEKMVKESKSRLRFYEAFGARPIINTKYESPLNPEDTCMPYLVYDGLKKQKKITNVFLQKVVRAVLERKYNYLCSPEYITNVVNSIKDNPVRLRDYKYIIPESVKIKVTANYYSDKISLIINEKHIIHHVHERGYVESPVRVGKIISELEKVDFFENVKPLSFPSAHIDAVHDFDFVRYLKRACKEVPEGKSLYPYVFPIRNKTRPPKDMSVLAGYYCIDTFTPINQNAYPAARRAVDCALTAAKEIMSGRRIAYALVRPPGHHAERRSFGGFCYFNNNAIAAQYLTSYGKVAILDIDYHHGNGQEDIFYRSSDVFTVSIHGDPKFAYPYFSGFTEDVGEGEGEGFNFNIPLPESINGIQYRKSLEQALKRIEEYRPDFLIVALGLDTAKGDPTGTWSLLPRDFEYNGKMIGEIGLPTLVIQEGGYRTRTLGSNALNFFKGLASTALHPRKQNNKVNILPTQESKFRYTVKPQDCEIIRKMVRATNFFNDSEVNIAVELIRERLNKGSESGYHFIFIEYDKMTAGYCCYGDIPGTLSSYDIYWVVVHPNYQGKGIGKKLITDAERLIKKLGGSRVYVETSQRPQYDPTRIFYEKCGYHVESVMDSFYAPGEGKVIYCKDVSELKV
ncbi:MAG: GNAT family N-acetyltransferase [Desulfobacterales bacterium]|nr:GNAT family N-acetyltransferase [Desulfobacterales bacterium]